MCVWRGNRRSIVPEVVHQRLVVQVGSTCNLAELANPCGRRFPARGTCVRGNGRRFPARGTCVRGNGRRFPARGTCVRGNISMRIERRWTVDRARGVVSESCRTTRLHLQLSRVGDFIQWKVSSTWYMCPWEHFHAYGGELVGRSCLKWCIRELSYKLPPAAT